MKKNKAPIGHRKDKWRLQHCIQSQGNASRRRLHCNETLKEAGSKAYRHLQEECSRMKEQVVQTIKQEQTRCVSNNQEPSVA